MKISNSLHETVLVLYQINSQSEDFEIKTNEQIKAYLRTAGSIPLMTMRLLRATKSLDVDTCKIFPNDCRTPSVSPTLLIPTICEPLVPVTVSNKFFTFFLSSQKAIVSFQ